MKKILTLFAVVGLIVFSSCEGPEGPPGLDGAETPLPVVFQVNANFTSPGFAVTAPLSGLLPSDVVLVYELVGTTGGNTWALLPQVYYFNDGTETAQYNYSFSSNNVTIFIDGSLTDFSQLPSEFRLGKTFRVVIVPADFLNSNKSVNKSDYQDYNAVIKKYNIDDSNVKKLN